MSTDPRLVSVFFCQPEAQRFDGSELRKTLALPLLIPAGRAPLPEDIGEKFVSPYLRPSDVPLAFHREATPIASPFPGPQRAMFESSGRLESQGRTLQYGFSDGTVITGHQILFHPYSRLVPRHFLPLLMNLSATQPARRPPPAFASHTVRRAHWQAEADTVITSVLTAASRLTRHGRLSDEVDPIDIFFCVDDDPTRERWAAQIDTVETGGASWGPWQARTESEESPVFYGRARVELDSARLGDFSGLSQTFLVDPKSQRLIFHTFAEQAQRLTTRLSGSTAAPGFALELKGHSQIQTSLNEARDLLDGENVELPLKPGSREVGFENLKPSVRVTGDGSFQFMVHAKDGDREWEIHGFPQSCAYLLLNLQNGLGATTGYSNTQIAHHRRGLKRERDLKILKSIGYSTLIFYEAARFALDQPLTDGTVCKTEQDVCESLFVRLGNLILKSEGWPVQSGSVTELCSKNVSTLIEGFVKQVVADLRGRDLCVYTPEGELRLKEMSRFTALVFYALVGDLAVATAGQCFGKARSKHFETFLNGRANPEREDMAMRPAVSAEVAAQMIYQPGINERYLLPESNRALGMGSELLGLLHRGFALTIDGKEVEEFDAEEFRPEFLLREETDENVPTGGHRIDWFELHPKFFFKGTEITGNQAQRLSKEGLLEFQGRLYRVKNEDMPNIKRLSRFWASIQAHEAGLMKGKRRKTEDTYFQLPRSQTLELLALRASGVKIRGGERWDEICRFYDSLNEERPPIQIPASFKTDLQPYQKTGVAWIRDLQRLGLGGILADDMGLGKTVTSLAFLESLRADDEMGSCLVLVPTSLTYNWLSEAQRFAPEIPIRIFSSRESEAMLEFVQKNRHSMVVCTYGLLQENTEFFQQVRWSCLILDEAQNLKNIGTKRTTAARKLEAAFKLCLTGTPIENHYGELYSLFDLIVPGALGDLASFRERYVNPTRVPREDIDDLRLKSKPLILRRTKGQVMHQLPPKIETTVKLPFEEEQRKIYRDIASSYNEQVKNAISTQGEAKSQLQMLTALLRLRQVCSDPAAIPGVVYTGEPPKISTLIEAVEELVDGGASALVFTQFLATFDRIRAGLTKAGVPFFDISGADSRLAREKKLKAFQEFDGGAVMLMTLKTGGVGLNLVKASYIFHIEPWWNPAVENQATDRAHRIGQTKTVQIYRYLIKDSVEEKIEVLKDIKAKRFNALFSSAESDAASEFNGDASAPAENSSSGALTQRDFEFLLGM